MFKPRNLFLTISTIVVISLIIGWGISMVLAWQDPTASPPGGNVFAPINVSSTDQTKAGMLRADGGFQVDGTTAVAGSNRLHYTFYGTKYTGFGSEAEGVFGINANATDTVNFDFIVTETDATAEGNFEAKGDITVGGILRVKGSILDPDYATVEINDSLSVANNLTVTNDLTVGGTIFGDLTAAGGWTDDNGFVRLSTSTDSVGIGIATPGKKLHVVGDGLVDGNFYVDTDSGVNAAYITRLGSTDQGLKIYSSDRDLYTRYIEDGGEASPGTWHFINERSGAESYEFMTAQTDGDLILTPTAGNVGIGTTGPGYKLQVNGDVRVGSNLRLSSNTPIYALNNAGGGWVEIGRVDTSDRVRLGPAQEVTITGGNVGIGDTTPAGGTAPDTGRKLMVNGGVTIAGGSMLSFDKNYYVHAYEKYQGQSGEKGFLHYGYYGHEFSTRQGSAMVIRGDSNNVGIGDTDPAEELVVSGDAVITGTYYKAESGAPSGYIWAISPTYPNYGIYYLSSSPDKVQYMWNGTAKIDMGIETGDITATGTICDSGGSNCIGGGGDNLGDHIATQDLNMDSNSIINANIMGPAFGGGNFLGLMNNKLIRADRKHTVTCDKALRGGSIANMFDGKGDSQADWDDIDLPVSCTIDFNGAILHYWQGLAIHFPYSRRMSGVKIEKFADAASPWSCAEAVWSTIYDTTSNNQNTIIDRSGYGNGICKFRITISGTSQYSNDIRIGEIAAWQYYYGQDGAFMKVTGDTMWGELKVNGTTAIAASNRFHYTNTGGSYNTGFGSSADGVFGVNPRSDADYDFEVTETDATAFGNFNVEGILYANGGIQDFNDATVNIGESLAVSSDLTVSGGDIYNLDANHRWQASGNWNYFYSQYGYIRFGPNNTSWAHIYTDRPAFYMDKGLSAASFTSRGGNITMTPSGPNAWIADTFAANTYKNYINFNAGSGSNDPGAILHETSGTETNEGVLHLMPSDDNSYGDYVSIHGTNDPDVLKLHTSGVIEGVTTLTTSGNVTVGGNVTATGTICDTGGSNCIGGGATDCTACDGRFVNVGGDTMTGQLTINGTSPQLKWNDTDQDDFWIHVNSNNFYVLPDRDDSGSYEAPYALQLEADTNIGYLFGNRITTENIDTDTTCNGISCSISNTGTLDGYNATTGSSASAIAVRNSSGDINARLFRSEYDSTNATINYIMTQIDTASNNYIRPSTPTQLATALTSPLETYFLRSNTSDTMSGNLTVTGDLTVGGRTFTNFGSLRTFENVAYYYNGNAINTGTIVITIGSTPNVMLDAEITIQGYGGLTECRIRGYTYTGSTTWHQPAATCISSGHSGGYTVRFGKRASDNARVILIGTTSSSWGNYPHVLVKRVTIGYPGSGTALGDWSISIVTNESAYTSITNIVENSTFQVGKLTVGTIDPIYEIDGIEYATYVADFAGGVRMETSGVIELDSESKYVIDFEDLETGSDLWLFWETSNKEMDDLVVILTPNFDGRAWYEYNKDENRLIIFGDRPGKVSYRLTLPREDDEDWGNLVVPEE